MRIEEAKPEESHQILRVINKANREAFSQIIPKEHFKEPILTSEEMEKCLENMTFYVHRHKGNIVAVAALSIVDDVSGRIRWVYVLPEFQKQGIGAALVIHIEQIAKEMGLRKIILITDSKAKWAIRFYKKLGYTLTSKVSNPWGFDVWMEKQLQL